MALEIADSLNKWQNFVSKQMVQRAIIITFLDLERHGQQNYNLMGKRRIAGTMATSDHEVAIISNTAT